MNKNRDMKLYKVVSVISLGVLLTTDLAAEEEEKKPTSTADSKSPKEKPKPSENEEQQAAKEVTGIYVHIPSFRIPIIQDGINRSNFLIEIMVEAYDHDKALFIYKMRPKIIDGLLVDLHGVFSVIWHPEFHVDLVELKERLFRKCEEILGKNVIKDLLVQQFTTQR